MPFLNKLTLTSIRGTKYFRVDGKFLYGSNKQGSIFQVPDGYKTDFASIPRIFWTVLGHPAGKHRDAAVVHDYLCTSKIVPRNISDAVFEEGMSELGVNVVRRKVYWAGVRTYWLLWGKWFS